MPDIFRMKQWDLIKWRNLWFAISLIVILPGVVFWVKQGFNLGIDFTGGGLITYQLARPLTSGQAERAEQLAELIERETPGHTRVRVQITGDVARGRAQDQILVRTLIAPNTPDAGAVLEAQRREITALLEREFAGTGGQPGVREASSEMVSPVVSRELVWNAVYAVALGCIFILAWVRIRYFDFKWAFSAVVALAHDVLVLLGVFAIFHQFEINMPFVAAALTVVGFSVHDTIVIFDRIRENIRLRKGNSFAETANISLIETMTRSINTGLTVIFVLLAVYVLGGKELRDFTFAMLIGIISGSYSSIFNASQILVVLKQREERALARRRAAQTGGRRAGVPSRATQAASPADTARPAAKPVAEAAPGTTAESVPAPSNGEPVAARDEEKARARRKMKAAGKRKRRF